MSTIMTSQTLPTKSPCGCSGSSASPHSCGCGGAGCSSCQGQAFIRPRFFAGQLLTEDDLQSLTNYVVGKNRLRNRFLFGSGVVCGLQVKPNPCECGQVVVSPGYALDCCGNDIVVACPKTLDINKMVRDLKIKLRGGYDCGDPCSDTSKTTTTPANPTTGVFSRGTPSDPSSSTAPPADSAKTYCLYADYCEQSTDPVAAYATAGSCGQPSCEPTRVHEGFTFELRCPPHEDCEPGVCERLTQCLGPAAENSVTSAVPILREYAETVPYALEQIRSKAKSTISQADVNASIADLQKAERVESPTSTQVKTLTLALRNAAVAVQSAASILTTRSVTAASEENASPLRILRGAAGSLQKQSTKLDTALWQSYAQAVATLAQKVADYPQTSGAITESNTPRSATSGTKPSATTPNDLQLLAWGAVVTKQHMADSFAAARELQSWLAERQDRSAQLLSETDQLRSAVFSEQFTLDQAGALATEIHRITASAARFLKDCLCNALLPPCRTCSDTSVLIACITVKDCCVTEICNLDRTFVLSPNAFRYWVPAIHELGEGIEEFCCPSCCEPSFAPDPYQSRLTATESENTVSELLGRASPHIGELAILSLLRTCVPTPSRRALQPQQTNFERSVASVISRFSPADPTVDAPLPKIVADSLDSLNSTQADVEKLKSDYAKLLERFHKLEARKTPKSGSEG